MAPTPQRWLFFVLAAMLLLVWQMALQQRAPELDHSYSNLASSGVHREDRFIYFLYHLNLYPVATTLQDPADRPEEASAILLHHGDTLLTEVNNTARYGEHLKSWLLLLDARWRGASHHPSYIFANGWAFRLALLTLLAAFWWAGHAGLGMVLTLLLGSNPFQLHEVYARENVHGWVITTAIFLLALFLPILREKSNKRYAILAAVVAGIWLGTILHLRTEPVAMILGCATAFLIMSRTPLPRRLLLVALLGVTFVATSSLWHNHFQWKIRESFTAVQAAGGVPYAGPREYTHQFWHPLHVGVADFDYTYGIKWDDRWAAQKIFPLLTQRHGTILPPWNGKTYHFEGVYHDEGQRYRQALLLIPGLYDLSRELFLENIARDPLWYGTILLKRGWALLDNLTPPRVETPWFRWEIPFHGLFLFPLLYLLWHRRQRLYLKIALFTLPTCLPPFAIYSGRGMTYLAIYHLITLGLLLTLLGEWAMGKHSPRKTTPALPRP